MPASARIGAVLLRGKVSHAIRFGDLGHAVAADRDVRHSQRPVLGLEEDVEDAALAAVLPDLVGRLLALEAGCNEVFN